MENKKENEFIRLHTDSQFPFKLCFDTIDKEGNTISIEHPLTQKELMKIQKEIYECIKENNKIISDEKRKAKGIKTLLEFKF